MEKRDNGLNLNFKELVKSIRTGDYGNASAKLNETLQLLQNDLSDKKIQPQDIQLLTTSLQTLFYMQKIGDWVAVADVLEYEFIDLWENTKR